MPLKLLALCAATWLAFSTDSFAACGDPDAIGVSRTIAVDTSGGLEVGSSQYGGHLPLRDMEVVLTFDDGPFPGPTEKVLDALHDACTQATFFVVGRMARTYPDVLRRELAEGHSIGTHSWSHPLPFDKLPYDEGAYQIDRGITAVTAVLGEPPAPFFRFPGLGHTHALRHKLAMANIAVFSADAMGYDWTGLSGDGIRLHALSALKEHRGGILLLHDIQAKTAAVLPQLLKDMKAAGFSVVHIVPARSVAVAALPPSKGGGQFPPALTGTTGAAGAAATAGRGNISATRSASAAATHP